MQKKFWLLVVSLFIFLVAPNLAHATCEMANCFTVGDCGSNNCDSICKGLGYVGGGCINSEVTCNNGPGCSCCYDVGLMSVAPTHGVPAAKSEKPAKKPLRVKGRKAIK